MIGTPSQYSASKLVGPNPPAELSPGEYFSNLKEGNKIVASLWVKKYNNSYILRDVFVLPEERGKGYGSRLVQGIVDHLKPKDLPIYLYVDPHNKPAVSLYKNLGFVRIKRETVYGDKYAYKE